MREFEQSLQASLSSFVADIERLVRAAARDALEDCLGPAAVSSLGDGVAAAPRARGAARPATARPTTARRGGKRSPEHLADLTRALDAFIRKNQGLGIEAIGKRMGTSTRELALPMKKLLSERRIAARGVKRATRYFAR